MTKQPRYYYRVRNRNGRYEAWTGSFETLRKARVWYKKHGIFHSKRGHILALFHGGKLVRVVG